MDKYIQTGNINDTICCSLESSGPYITSYYYKIFGKTTINILWEKYDGGNFDKDIESSTYGKWITKYKKIDLGIHTFKYNKSNDNDYQYKGDNKNPIEEDEEYIIDITNKFTCGTYNDKALQIDNMVINSNSYSSSSDKYYIKFLTNTKYLMLKDSYVDH